MAKRATLVDEVVRLGLGGVLRAEGFKKSHHTFRHQLGSVLQIVNVQGSWTNTQGDESFTINLGVHFQQVDALTGMDFTKRQPAVQDAVLDVRIGTLMQKRSDRWWNLDVDSNLSAIAAELISVWNSIAKPWFDRCATIEGALGFAKERELYGPAFLLALAAKDHEEAKIWLRVISESTGGMARDRFVGIAAKQSVCL